MDSRKASAILIVLFVLLTAYLAMELFSARQAVARLKKNSDSGKVQQGEHQKGKQRQASSAESLEAEIRRLKKEIERLRDQARTGSAGEKNASGKSVGKFEGDDKQKLLELIYLGNPNSRLKIMEEFGLTPTTDDYRRMLYASLKDKNFNWQAFNTLVGEWFKVDVDSLLDWAQTTTKDEELAGNPFARNLLAMIGNNFPGNMADKATEFISRLPEGESRDMMINSLIYKYCTSNPDDTRKWFDGIKNETYKLGAVMAIARGMAMKEGYDVAGWINSLPDGNLKDRAYESYVVEYARKDPDAALDLAENISNSDVYVNAVSNAMSMLAMKDPARAGEMLKKYPPGALKDRCTENYVYNISHNYPETAALWADEISDDTKRSNVLNFIASTWMTRPDNRQAFEEWFRNVNMPAEMRDRLEKQYDAIKKLPKSPNEQQINRVLKEYSE